MDVSTTTHDLFLSYNSRDRTMIEAVAGRLRERGLSVFLDQWYFVPGRPWPQALEEALGACRAVAVFIGPSGMGSWQQREKWLALDRQARDEAFPVIPVLLPGAEPALEFLSLMTWVDLRQGVEGVAALDALAAAARGEALGPEAAERARADVNAICPYRGLHFFREEDAPFFFGREAFTERLVEAVALQSLVAVVGASGSGKSSVVRAGLLPRLRRGREPVWEIATLVPGGRPLRALAAALLPFLEPAMTEVDRLTEVAKLAECLNDGTLLLADVVTRVLEKQEGTGRLLLVIDQWEELYTLAEDGEQVARFIDAVLAASETGPLTVVLTMRGDFFGQALEHRALADRLQDNLSTVGPMTPDELERAIVKPADQVGLTFETGLVERILGDVGTEPGNLPLLEFVLSGLWDVRRGGKLHHDTYDEMGGAQGAMAKHADAAWKRLEGQHAEAVKALFLQLVRSGEETADTRRRMRLDDLAAEARAMVADLTEARLLVTGCDEASGEETVEVAHEALIRNWKRLQDWLDEEREFLTWHQRLSGFVDVWERSNRNKEALLRGPSLAEADRWLRSKKAQIATSAIAFVQESLATRRRKRLLGFGTVAFTCLASVAVAWWQFLEAEKMRRERDPIKPVMIPIEPGSFVMGSSFDNWLAQSNEKPPRLVSLDQAFAIGKYEVTFSEFDRFVLATNRRSPGDAGWGTGNRPVINVSWMEAKAYADWLSDKTGNEYRLPTEAEWEYAARGGTKTHWYWGDRATDSCHFENGGSSGSIRAEPSKSLHRREGWGKGLDPDCEDPFKEQTAPRGSFNPNPYGLHDMGGNVAEWVQDCFIPNYVDAPSDGSARIVQGCKNKVIRGGSWETPVIFLRSSHRYELWSGDRTDYVGFRLAQDL